MLTNKASHNRITLFQSFISLGRLKHQPFNGFYLFSVLLQNKTDKSLVLDLFYIFWLDQEPPVAQ